MIPEHLKEAYGHEKLRRTDQETKPVEKTGISDESFISKPDHTELEQNQEGE